MRYNRLPHSVLSNTMQSGVVSKTVNIYEWEYFTRCRWSQCHSMKLKSKAHESLSILFKHDSVPHKIVVDNSKEQSLGKFASKCYEAYFHLVNTANK